MTDATNANHNPMDDGTQDERAEMFEQRYVDGDAPWDTGITPPELVALVPTLPKGRALDLGCGTGTNVGYLLEQGWQADGVDFAQSAIDTARAKLSIYPSEQWGAFCHDVTKLNACEGLRPPYDLIVDIGCGHGLKGDDAEGYARDVADLLAEGGVFTLYTHAPTEERHFGWTEADVEHLFAPHFDIFWREMSEDTATGVPSGWFRMKKK
jgi:SAM-dependent methyltransferase